MEPNNTSSNDPIAKFLNVFKSGNMTPLNAMKLAIVAIIGLLVLAFAFQLIGSSFRALSGNVGHTIGLAVAPMAPSASPSYGYGGGTTASDMGGPDYNYASKEIAYSTDGAMPTLSSRNAAMVMPYPQPGTPGNTAEQLEVTQYNASIETRNLKQTCGTVAALKSREDVIFENSNMGDQNCNFTFKVTIASADQVLAVIKGLNPKDLSENTYTIKNQIDDYTNSTEILLKKRDSIDETLKSAINAYNDVTVLATKSQNADALAQIINSKIAIIERLTEERININTQLDQITRAKADQLDNLDYKRFSVNVYENKFVDGQALRDSWKQATQQFVYNLNQTIQALSLNLILLLLTILQWILYAVIALFIAKYGWKFAKRIWYS